MYKNEDIIVGLSTNDHKVLNYLYKEIGPKVKNMVMNMGGSIEEANDIFQEGMIAAYVNIKSGKYQLSENAKFSTYLQQLCKYKWYDVCKSAHKSKGASLDADYDADVDIASSVERSEKYNELIKCLNSLGRSCRDILKLFYWEKESMDSIAQILNITPATAKNNKYRCMQKLKEIAPKMINL